MEGLSVTSGPCNVFFWGAVVSLAVAYLIGPLVYCGAHLLAGATRTATVGAMESCGRRMVLGGICAFVACSVLLIVTLMVQAFASRSIYWLG